jgi:hypothetical protein
MLRVAQGRQGAPAIGAIDPLGTPRAVAERTESQG